MGRGTILAGGDDGLYVVRLSEAPPDAEARVKKLDAQRVKLSGEVDALYLLQGLQEQELDAAALTLDALLKDWMERLAAGQEGDPPIDPTDPDQSGAVSGWEDGLLAAHNLIRVQHGLNTLQLVSELSVSAQGHAAWLAARDTTGHEGAMGSTPQDRIYAAGYPQGPGGGSGENCAYGQTSVSMVMEGWMGSPHHRANILEGRYQDVGFGYAYRASGTWRHFWVVNFGRMPQ